MSTLAQILTEKAPGSAKWANGTITLFSLFLLAIIFVSLQTFLIMVPVMYQHFVIQVASILLTHLYFACVSNKTFINRLTASMYSFYDLCTATFRASDREISRAVHVGLFVLVVDLFLIALMPQPTLVVLLLPALLGHVVYQLIWPFHHANFANHFCDDMPEHIAASALLCMLCNDSDLRPYLPSRVKDAPNPIDLIKQSQYETQKNFLSSASTKLGRAHFWSNNEKGLRLYKQIIESASNFRSGVKELVDKNPGCVPQEICQMFEEERSAHEIYQAIVEIIHSDSDANDALKIDLNAFVAKQNPSFDELIENLKDAHDLGDISQKYISEKTPACAAICHTAYLLESDQPLFRSQSEKSNLIEYINKCRSLEQCII